MTNHGSIPDYNQPGLRLDADSAVIVAINEDGSETFWLMVRGCDDTGPIATPDHEQVGPLPDHVLDRLTPPSYTQCGAPRVDGHPCRANVGKRGGHCRAHQQVTA